MGDMRCGGEYRKSVDSGLKKATYMNYNLGAFLNVASR